MLVGPGRGRRLGIRAGVSDQWERALKLSAQQIVFMMESSIPSLKWLLLWSRFALFSTLVGYAYFC
jgi:hypothetical protein